MFKKNTDERELATCPFCGGKAELKVSMFRTSQDYSCDPVSLANSYYVECTQCTSRSAVYISNIYQDRDGFIRVEANGAEDAINAWNKREGNDD